MGRFRDLKRGVWRICGRREGKGMVGLFPVRIAVKGCQPTTHGISLDIIRMRVGVVVWQESRRGIWMGREEGEGRSESLRLSKS